MIVQKTLECGFPIFDAVYYKDRLIVAGGGGGQQFGIQNQIQILDSRHLELYNSYELDQIIEKIQISEVDDILVANSDTNIYIYKIVDHKQIKLLKKLEFFQKEKLEEIFVHYDQNLLIYQTTEGILIIDKLINDKLVNYKKISLDQKVYEIIVTNGQKDLIICMKNKLSLYSIINEKCLYDIQMDKNLGRKKFMFIKKNNDVDKDDQLIFITSDFMQSILYIIIKDQNNKYSVCRELKLTKKQISSVTIFEDNLYVSNVNGDLLIFDYQNNKIKLLQKKKQLHNFPISKILVRNKPTTNKQKELLKDIQTFSTDSFMKSLKIKKEQDKHKYSQYLFVYSLLL